MQDETTTKEAAKLIADAMREVLKTLASEAQDSKRLIASDAERATRVIETKSVADKDAGSFSNIIYKQVSFGLSIAGIVFGAFIYLTSPSQKNDTALQLQEQRIEAQEVTIATITKTQQNDTQEVKGNVALMTSKIEQQSIEIAKLTTIINERIPARK